MFPLVRTVLEAVESRIHKSRESYVRYLRSLWPETVRFMADDIRIQTCSYSYEGKTQRCWRFLGMMSTPSSSLPRGFLPDAAADSGEVSAATARTHRPARLF